MLDCVICLRETHSLTTLTCSHSFCEDCVGCWLAISNKCPLCTQIVSDTSPAFKHQEQDHPVCVDFSYDLSFVQRKLGALFKQVNNKLQASQNVKSCVSKVDAQQYYSEYKEAEQLVHILELLVAQNSSNSQITHLLETINFKLLDLENILNGRVDVQYSREQKWVNEQDYEDDFPQIGGYEKYEKKMGTKGSKNKEKKQRSKVK